MTINHQAENFPGQPHAAGNMYDGAFYLLSTQISRMTEEVVAQRAAHTVLVEKFTEQSILIATLAARIEAHNRLIDERSGTNHSRILSLETNHAMTSDRVSSLERWQWRMVGIVGGLFVLLELIDKFGRWTT